MVGNVNSTHFQVATDLLDARSMVRNAMQSIPHRIGLSPFLNLGGGRAFEQDSDDL
jgi:hypothetical protein